MKLQAICQSCKSPIKVRSFASTRPDLQMDKGEVFPLNCTNCGSNQSTHINDVEAVSSQGIILGGAILSILVIIVLWFSLGAFGTITAIIPLWIWQQQNKSAHLFNSYKRPRRN